jgi:hypothetical protein
VNINGCLLSVKTDIELPPNPLTLSFPSVVMNVTAGLSVDDVSVFADSEDYIITYICRLCPKFGAAILTLPMSSFQGRFKSGDPSYLSVVIPGLDYALEISNLLSSVDRISALALAGIGNPIPEGAGVVYMGFSESSAYPELSVYIVKTFADGHVITEQLMAVTLEKIDTEEGGTNQSIILEGHRTKTYTPKIVNLTGSSYRSSKDGKLRYRCAPDLFLRPGDTVNINGETFTADDITIYKSVESETFEFSQGIVTNPVIGLNEA